MGSPRLLVVDDDPALVEFVTRALERSNLIIESAGSGEAALRKVREHLPDLMLLDLVLPGINGVETLRRLREEGFEFPVVLITSHGGMDTTMQAMEQGAWDYLAKPLRTAELTALVARCLRHSGRGEPVEPLDEDPQTSLIGNSAAMVELFKSIARVARQPANVLLIGEPGSGKRLVARVIHRHSGRAGPFLTLDCAALPETLLERALFGPELEQEAGMLERARQGTLLLEHVGELPLLLQSRLQRFLEERIHPAETRKPGAVARVIATSHEELGAQVAKGAFRGELLTRLAEVSIRVPPLRERGGGDDLRLLTDELTRQLAQRAGREITSLEPAVYRRLQQYSWPGNVRELQRVLEQALAAGPGPVLRASELPEWGSEASSERSGASQLEILEQTHIARVLEESGWNQSIAARRLGIHRNTLRRKIRQYQLRTSTKPRPFLT